MEEEISPTLPSAMAQYNEKLVERDLSDRLVQGFLLLETPCPDCATPLIKSKDEASTECGELSPFVVARDVMETSPPSPVDCVPFCVFCKSHVVLDKGHVVSLEKTGVIVVSKSVALKYSSLIAQEEKSNKDERGDKYETMVSGSENSQSNVEKEGDKYETMVPGSDNVEKELTVIDEVVKGELTVEPEGDKYDAEDAAFTSTTVDDTKKILTEEVLEVKNDSLLDGDDSMKDETQVTAITDQNDGQALSSGYFCGSDVFCGIGGVGRVSPVPDAPCETEISEMKEPAIVTANKSIEKNGVPQDGEPVVISQEAIKTNEERNTDLDNTDTTAAPRLDPPEQKEQHSNDSSQGSALEENGTVENKATPQAEEDADLADYEVKKSIATKVLGAKMLQGYSLKETQCQKCSMPLMEFEGKLNCEVCPVLERKLKKKTKASQYEEAEKEVKGLKQCESIEVVANEPEPETSAADEPEPASEPKSQPTEEATPPETAKFSHMTDEELLAEQERLLKEARHLEQKREAEEAQAKEAMKKEAFLVKEEVSPEEIARLEEEKRREEERFLFEETRRLEMMEDPTSKRPEADPSRSALSRILEEEAIKTEELRKLEEARIQARSEATALSERKKVEKETEALSKLEQEAEENAMEADEAIARAKAALDEVTTVKKKLLSEAVEKAKADAIAEMESNLILDTVRAVEEPSVPVVEKAPVENLSAKASSVGNADAVVTDEVVDWENLRAECHSAMTKRMLEGYRILIDDYCKGQECGHTSLLQSKEGIVECVICKGSGSGLDGLYLQTKVVEEVEEVLEKSENEIKEDPSEEETKEEGKEGIEENVEHIVAEDVPFEIETEEPVVEATVPLMPSSPTAHKSVAELKQEYHEKRQLVSQEIGKKMLIGWTLLDMSCPSCDMPVMNDSQGGPAICVLCGPLRVQPAEHLLLPEDELTLTAGSNTPTTTNKEMDIGQAKSPREDESGTELEKAIADDTNIQETQSENNEEIEKSDDGEVDAIGESDVDQPIIEISESWNQPNIEVYKTAPASPEVGTEVEIEAPQQAASPKAATPVQSTSPETALHTVGADKEATEAETKEKAEESIGTSEKECKLFFDTADGDAGVAEESEESASSVKDKTKADVENEEDIKDEVVETPEETSPPAEDKPTTSDENEKEPEVAASELGEKTGKLASLNAQSSDTIENHPIADKEEITKKTTSEVLQIHEEFSPQAEDKSTTNVEDKKELEVAAVQNTIENHPVADKEEITKKTTSEVLQTHEESSPQAEDKSTTNDEDEKELEVAAAEGTIEEHPATDEVGVPEKLTSEVFETPEESSPQAEDKSTTNDEDEKEIEVAAAEDTIENHPVTDEVEVTEKLTSEVVETPEESSLQAEDNSTANNEDKKESEVAAVELVEKPRGVSSPVAQSEDTFEQHDSNTGETVAVIEKTSTSDKEGQTPFDEEPIPAAGNEMATKAVQTRDLTIPYALTRVDSLSAETGLEFTLNEHLCVNTDQSTVASSEIRTNPTDEIGFSELSANPTDEIGISGIRANPTDEIGFSEIRTDPTDEIGFSEIRTDPTDEIALPEITADPTDEIALPEITADPTDEIALPEITANPTDEIALPEIRANPTDEIALPEIRANPTDEINPTVQMPIKSPQMLKTMPSLADQSCASSSIKTPIPDVEYSLTDHLDKNFSKDSSESLVLTKNPTDEIAILKQPPIMSPLGTISPRSPSNDGAQSAVSPIPISPIQTSGQIITTSPTDEFEPVISKSEPISKEEPSEVSAPESEDKTAAAAGSENGVTLQIPNGFDLSEEAEPSSKEEPSEVSAPESEDKTAAAAGSENGVALQIPNGFDMSEEAEPSSKEEPSEISAPESEDKTAAAAGSENGVTLKIPKGFDMSDEAALKELIRAQANQKKTAVKLPLSPAVHQEETVVSVEEPKPKVQEECSTAVINDEEERLKQLERHALGLETIPPRRTSSFGSLSQSSALGIPQLDGSAPTSPTSERVKSPAMKMRIPSSPSSSRRAPTPDGGIMGKPPPSPIPNRAKNRPPPSPGSGMRRPPAPPVSYVGGNYTKTSPKRGLDDGIEQDDLSTGSRLSRAESVTSVASDALEAILNRIEEAKAALVSGKLSVQEQVEYAGLIEKLAQSAAAIRRLEQIG